MSMPTSEITKLELNSIWGTLSHDKRRFIDFRATWGSRFYTESGRLRHKRCTVKQLATEVGHHRRTLYKWQNRIPNFNSLVVWRRATLKPELEGQFSAMLLGLARST